MTIVVKIGDDKSHVKGVLYFDVVTSFSEKRGGQVTAFPLDSGVSIADHFIAKNATFEVRGVLSAVDISGTSSRVTIDGSKPNNAKEQPETPSISDTGTGLMSLLPGSINQFFKTSIPQVSSSSRVVQTEEKVKEVLRELLSGRYYNEALKRWQNRMTPVTLYEMSGTNIRTMHTDLVLTDFSIDEDADSGSFNIPLSLTFEKVRFVKVEKTKKGTPKPSAAKKVKAAAKKGVKAQAAKVCKDVPAANTGQTVQLPSQPKLPSGSSSFSSLPGTNKVKSVVFK